jgi:dolichol-phosphate mannosyltransferase
LIDRKVVDEYNKLTERNRVTRNLIDWLGFKRSLIPFDAKERHTGTAAYSFKKLVKLAIDGIVKQSTKPLKLIGILGLIISLLSVLAGLFFLIEQYLLSDPLGLAISGTALLALFLSFLVGIVLLCQGFLALYLENVYHETQNRPLYIIDEEK